MSKSFHLVLKKGPGPGQVFSIEKDQITIGRDIQCDISIIESSVSRRHARLFLKDEQVYIEDLGSTNGTTVEGVAVTEPQHLDIGKVVGIGHNIEFELNESVATDQATEVFSKDILQSVLPETRPSKVFISYSRRNQPFVEQLHASLTKEGLDTWVDWEGIPLTADWWAEIVDAIEGSDGFVFVITPDSLASEICGRELQTAIEQNKRLIPILHIDPEKGSEIPDQISSHNWVFMRDETELGEMLPKLIESIYTDLEWVKIHTRLLRRASEWNRREKNPSLLLQGDDLHKAEEWLQDSAENEPQATPLHFEYIQDSRQNANRRQRTTLIASLVALGITLVLAVVSLFLYFDAEDARKDAVAQFDIAEIARATAEAAKIVADEEAENARAAEIVANEQADLARAAEEDANEQRDEANAAKDEANAAREEAERQAAKAYAGEIGAKALILLETNPPLAVLLALESQRISPEDTTAAEVLSQAPAFYSSIASVSYDPDFEVSEVAWSPDGLLAVALANDEIKLIRILNIDSGEVEQELFGHEYVILSMAWSPEGLFASGDDNGTIIIWDLDNGEPALTLPDYQIDISSLGWSSRGTLASTSYDSSLIIWDLVLEDYDVYVEYEGGGLTSLAWGPFGGLVTGADNGSIVTWDTASWDVIFSYEFHDAGVLSVSFNEAGQLASGSRDGTVGISSIYTGQGVKLRGHTDWVNVVDWSDDGRLASASWDDTVILWDLENGLPEQILRGHLGAVDSLDWGPDGQLASGVRYVFIWDTASVPAMTAFEGHLDWVYNLGWTDDGSLVSQSSDGSNILWDIDSRSPSASFEYTGDGFDISPGDLIVSGENILNLNTGDEYFVPGFEMQFSSDGSLIAGISQDAENEVKIWNVEAQLAFDELERQVFSFNEEQIVRTLVWSPNEFKLAVGAEDGSITILDVSSGEVIDMFTEHSGMIVDLAWSQDNKLASAGDDSRILVWNMDSMTVDKELSGVHDTSISSLDWSPDGWLATADDDGRIVIWDTDSGETLAIIRSPYKRRVNVVAWSPDGTLLAFGGNSYNVYIYNSFYMQDPCSWLPRNILDYEWSDYFPDREYEQTCPNLP